MTPEQFECAYGAAYRRAIATAERRASRGYQPGRLPRRAPLDGYEKRRQDAVDALLGPGYQIRGPDGHLYQGLPYPAANALQHYDLGEERIRRMAARP